jgi:hypothetical protein
MANPPPKVDIAVDIFGGRAVDCGCYKKRLIRAWLTAER